MKSWTNNFFRASAGQKLAAVAAAAAVVFLLVVWIFGAAMQQVTAGDAVRAAIREKIAHRAEERNRARVAEELMRERADDLARITGFFVDRHSPVGFLEAVEDVAGRTDNTIAIDVDEALSGEYTLHFRFAVAGGERDVLRFVQALELMPYRLRITEMALKNGSFESAPGSERAPLTRLTLAIDVSAR